MYEGEKGSWHKHLDFIVLDLIVLQLAFVFAYIIRHGFHSPYTDNLYTHVGVIICLLDLCVMFFTEAYSGILKRGSFKELRATVLHISVVVLLTFVYIFFTKSGEELSRMVLFLMWVFGCIFSYLGRSFWKYIVKLKSNGRTQYRKVLLLTSEALAFESIRAIRTNECRNYQIDAMVLIDADKCGILIDDIPVVANIEHMLEYVRTHIVDEIFINVQKSIDIPDYLISGFSDMGVTLHITLANLTGMTGTKTIEEFAGYSVLTSGIHIASPKQILMKRLMDICGGVIGVLITGILTVIVGPMIYCKDPGSVFFKQTRIGKNGREFELYKFRSMYLDAEKRKAELMKNNEMQGLMFKMEDDPRVLPGIGKIIRDWSIDEWPQMWNVLKGDMSLVGTRPPTVDEYVRYDLHHKKRLSTKPGLTGLWQVSGRSDIKDFEEVVKLDTKYIENWDIGQDIEILLKTLVVVATRKGSK